MRLSTIGPFVSPLRLSSSLDPKSKHYPALLQALPPESAHFTAPNRQRTSDLPGFSDLERDDFDLRLFVWSPQAKEGEPQLRFHIYGNGVGVVETHLDCADNFNADTLETFAQETTCRAIDAHGPNLHALLAQIESEISADLVATPISDDDTSIPLSRQAIWISRAVRITPAQREDERYRSLIRDWLKNTGRPDDAEDILSGKEERAISWMNYVLVDSEEKDAPNPLSAVRIAQFFFASQNLLNDAVHALLRDGEFERETRSFKAQLIHARTDMQMLRILFDVQLGYLSRQKRRDLDYLMTMWDFETLTRNGARILDACTQRITEITNARVERGAFYTDMILAFIALVSIIEVTLYLTEYSREVMSRPTLAYQDSKLSWFLSWFASIDMDRGLLSGAVLFFLMAGLYVFWKRR
ncbi:MAG: hypothetical protein AAF221_14315 [Pseudomonadota bacterium]